MSQAVAPDEECVSVGSIVPGPYTIALSVCRRTLSARNILNDRKLRLEVKQLVHSCIYIEKCLHDPTTWFTELFRTIAQAADFTL
jgi:hypothetical protein